MKLHLGCGDKYIDGWVNIDFSESVHTDLCLDLSKGRLPYDDNSVDTIIASHLIEHLTMKQGGSLLRECYRVLVKDGELIIVFPDIKKIIGVYNRTKNDGWLIRAIFEKQTTPDLFHYYGYTDNTMRESLKDCGFASIDLLQDGLTIGISGVMVFEILLLVTGFSVRK